MKYLRRCLQALGWLALTVGSVAAIGLAALIAANWRDDPLSEAAQQALRYTPPTEQALEDNGYLILLGLDAPARGDAVADAIALGRQRLAREIERRRWVEAHGDATDGMPPSIPVENAGEDVLPERLRCPAGAPRCFSWHSKDRTEIHALAQANQAQLQRLAAAANARQFSNPAPFYLLAEFPPFARLLRAHELWLAQASLQWTLGQTQEALDIARQAARLRSRLASHSNSLIASMIALAMQHRELRWLSEASAHLTPQLPAPVSKGIEELLSLPTGSLHHALEGEKQFTASITYALKDAQGSGLFTAPWDSPHATHTRWQQLQDRVSAWAYLPHQTLNLSIQNLQQVQASSALPAHRLEAAFSDILRQWNENNPCVTIRLRNAIGVCMAAIAMPSYQAYAQRMADMEGYRRLVLLQHRAAAQRIALADMPAWLAETPQELHNPYTLQPMQWDAATGSLVFEGREKQTQNPDQSPVYRIALRH